MKENNASQDSEITAMGALLEALDALDPEVRERVLRWASARYGITIGGRSRYSANSATRDASLEEMEFEDIASLHDAANPQTDPQRALVAGYWFQVLQGQPDLDAQALNTALKNLGHGISNITSSLTSLKDRKPALVLQTHKAGRVKQARKKYKLTSAGIRAVERMLAGSELEEE